MTEPSKPRQFLITDHTDNSGFSAVEAAYAVEHLSCNVIHVIEKSAYDALEQKIKELEAEVAEQKSLVKFYTNIKELTRFGSATELEYRQMLSALEIASMNLKLAKENEKLRAKFEKCKEQRSRIAYAYNSLELFEKTLKQTMDAELNGDK